MESLRRMSYTRVRANLGQKICQFVTCLVCLVGFFVHIITLTHTAHNLIEVTTKARDSDVGELVQAFTKCQKNVDQPYFMCDSLDLATILNNLQKLKHEATRAKAEFTDVNCVGIIFLIVIPFCKMSAANKAAHTWEWILCCLVVLGAHWGPFVSYCGFIVSVVGFLGMFVVLSRCTRGSSYAPMAVFFALLVDYFVFFALLRDSEDVRVFDAGTEWANSTKWHDVALTVYNQKQERMLLVSQSRTRLTIEIVFDAMKRFFVMTAQAV